MILPYGASSRVIDLERERRADRERAVLDHAGMDEQVARLLLGVGDLETKPLAEHEPGVADLAAGLAVERRLVKHDGAALPGLEGGTSLPSFTSAATTPSARSVS